MTHTEHRVSGGCIRLTVNDEHVALVLRTFREMERARLERSRLERRAA